MTSADEVGDLRPFGAKSRDNLAANEKESVVWQREWAAKS